MLITEYCVNKLLLKNKLFIKYFVKKRQETFLISYTGILCFYLQKVNEKNLLSNIMTIN